MQYKVFKQFPRDEERICAEFIELNDAKLFIEKKSAADASLKVKVIYRLYKDHEMLQAFNTEDMHSRGSQGTQTKSTSSFTPTPFNIAPKPAGVPHKWVVDKKEDDESKK